MSNEVAYMLVWLSGAAVSVLILIVSRRWAFAALGAGCLCALVPVAFSLGVPWQLSSFSGCVLTVAAGIRPLVLKNGGTRRLLMEKAIGVRAPLEADVDRRGGSFILVEGRRWRTLVDDVGMKAGDMVKVTGIDGRALKARRAFRG